LSGPADLIVVQISSDRDEEAFNEYYAKFAWGALPYLDRARKEKLSEKYGANGIPFMVALDGTSGELLSRDAAGDFRRAQAGSSGSPPLIPLILKWHGVRGSSSDAGSGRGPGPSRPSGRPSGRAAGRSSGPPGGFPPGGFPPGGFSGGLGEELGKEFARKLVEDEDSPCNQQ